ncbi:MAG: MBL fold metallo-hydrolase [Sphingopyxis sp.]|uniref:MBL fold metallo-hydrolase n=1 Tax=Sphingopyxis sp. TaxID=1908224 RepID=UPI002ABC51BE|nr:MBL fold metallo-hydrolase [Sphingopyxis sp.]MDZ3830432.1 MBL fold metallo-hydrolase [Sphingopyxis sp.]
MTRRAMLGSLAALPILGAQAPLAFASEAPGSDQEKSRLILLGTAGGPSPKPNRAAPAQAVVVGDAVYVVDCGNGVARQMILAGLRLDAIRGVFVTHHHSDHNADYGNLMLLAWANNLSSPVDCYGPPPLARMTEQFLALNDYDIQTRISDEGRVPLSGLMRPQEISAGGLVHQGARVRVTAALVDHPPVTPALAYRFDCPDRSIVFSGDTRPSSALVALAKGADILVHEVMHLPALDPLIASEPNARRLREHLIASHTTTEQVGRIATEAGVKTLVLSHFVPGGHPFVPDEIWLEAVRPHFDGEIIVGRDLMEV